MTWLSSVRPLLHDLKRSKCIKNSTPSELQLEQLHVEADESEREVVWDNIHTIGEIIGSEDARVSRYFMDFEFRGVTTARSCSGYVSSVLGRWITELSQRATDTIRVYRNHKLRVKNDTYSSGVSAELTMSYPTADSVMTFPYDKANSIPFSSVLIRERCRPDSSLTTAELYFLLAMASKHCKLLDITSIKSRVLIVYSHWVQVVNVTTTMPYITSIIDGQADIADKIIIHRTPWFNFLDVFGQLHVLLSAFEGIELGPKKVPKRVMMTQVPPQEIESTVPRQRSKRRLERGCELVKPRSKPQRVSSKQADPTLREESLVNH